MLTDKPWYKSMMVLGSVFIAASTMFENNGWLVPGTAVSLATAMKAIGEFLALVGARRKLGEISAA